jgi:predicted metalloprotease
MRIDGERESDNVEDRRGDDGGGGGGGGGFGLPHVGIGGVLIALAASWFLGVNPLTVLGLMNQAQQSAPQTQNSRPAPKASSADPQVKLAKVVLASTEDVWAKVLPQQMNMQYKNPTLTLFSGATNTACGKGTTSAGPFYCPGDQHLYIDLAFNQTLAKRLGAPGDFAQAYVIAHEVGHHVQTLLGIMGKADKLRAKLSETDYNTKVSVRIELQADCLAGVWAHHAQSMRNIMENGDLEAALRAAAAVGDDKLQREATGTVRPESFTHGTSQQRATWFKQGFSSGEVRQCDTFAAKTL